MGLIILTILLVNVFVSTEVFLVKADGSSDGFSWGKLFSYPMEAVQKVMNFVKYLFSTIWGRREEGNANEKGNAYKKRNANEERDENNSREIITQEELDSFGLDSRDSPTVQVFAFLLGSNPTIVEQKLRSSKAKNGGSINLIDFIEEFIPIKEFSRRLKDLIGPLFEMLAEVDPKAAQNVHEKAGDFLNTKLKTISGKNERKRISGEL